MNPAVSALAPLRALSRMSNRYPAGVWIYVGAQDHCAPIRNIVCSCLTLVATAFCLPAAAGRRAPFRIEMPHLSPTLPTRTISVTSLGNTPSPPPAIAPTPPGSIFSARPFSNLWEPLAAIPSSATAWSFGPILNLASGAHFLSAESLRFFS